MKKRFRFFLHFLLILSLPILMGVQGLECPGSDDEEGSNAAQQTLLMQSLNADYFTINDETIREAASPTNPFDDDPFVFAHYNTTDDFTTIAYGRQYDSGLTFPACFLDAVYIIFIGAGEGYHTFGNGWVQIDTWGDVGDKISGSYEFTQDYTNNYGTFRVTREYDDSISTFFP